jgi:hypothetical protein
VDVVSLTGEVVVGEGFSVELHGLDSADEADSVDFAVHEADAVDFSVSVDLAGLEAEDELAAPPLPLPVHLPPEDRVTSTQFFWSLTGTV